jgi:hypothetical protein
MRTVRRETAGRSLCMHAHLCTSSEPAVSKHTTRVTDSSCSKAALVSLCTFNNKSNNATQRPPLSPSLTGAATGQQHHPATTNMRPTHHLALGCRTAAYNRNCCKCSNSCCSYLRCPHLTCGLTRAHPATAAVDAARCCACSSPAAA